MDKELFRFHGRRRMQRDHPTVCRDAENKELNDMKTFKNQEIDDFF